MRHRQRHLLVVALIVACIAGDAGAVKLPAGAPSPPPPESNRLIVKLAAGIANSDDKSAGAAAEGLAAFDALNAHYGVVRREPLLAKNRLSGAGHALERVLVLELASGTDVATAAQAYADLGVVEYAHPDGELDLYGLALPPPIRDLPEPYPSDPYFAQQWSLHNTGIWYYAVDRQPDCGNDIFSYGIGSSDADIDFPAVYQDRPDESPVVVAIVDTGVDMTHPELANRIWRNTDEIAGNGIDDDHNGYVDDTVGWDFSGNDVGLYPIYEDNDPTDLFGHGTHCAGIVAAAMDNGQGIAGIAPAAQVMCLKIHPTLSFSMAARAIVYAADNGADVINMSWGAPAEIPVVEDALDYAAARGVVLVAAAGNDGYQRVNYPAGYPQTIAVAATDADDHVTGFSTFNSAIDVAAPGAAILSLRAAGTDLYAPCEPDVHVLDGIYYIASGTSMAAPHVAGVAAYVRSVAPGLAPAVVQDIIETSARDLVDPYGTGQSLPGWDVYSGHGRVNLRAALDQTPSLAAELTAPAAFDVVAGLVSVVGTARGGDFTGYELAWGAGAEPASWTTFSTSPAPVTGGVLGLWDTSGMAGEFVLRLSVGGQAAAYRRLFVANQPLAAITAPVAGAEVTGWVTVSGSAVAAGFDHYELSYGPATGEGPWTTVGQGSSPVYAGVLGAWNAGAAATGDHALRLTVHDASGVAASASVVLTVGAGQGWSVATGGATSRSANWGDFDGDGAKEVIIGTVNGLLAFDAAGVPTFAGLPEFPAGDFRMVPAVGELDGDGVDDLVAVDAEGTLWGWPSTAPAFTVDLGEAPNLNILGTTSGQRQARVFLRDVDGDGRDEIHYYPGEDAALPWHYTIRNSDGSIRAGFPLSGGYIRAQPADLDGDGLDEIYAFDGSLDRFDAAGVLQASTPLTVEGSPLLRASFSVVDVDDDGRGELIVMGAIQPVSGDDSWWLFALDEGLNLEPGWPRSLHIDTYYVPEHPRFGDLDGDGELEYATTYFDVADGYVRAWNLDGTDLLTGLAGVGAFASAPGPGIIFGPAFVDMDADGAAEIVAVSGSDIFMTQNIEYLNAWSADGSSVAGYPLSLAGGLEGFARSMAVPLAGDLDGDGILDLVYPSGVQQLRFLPVTGVAYDEAGAPAPMWWYNRRMNGIQAPTNSATPGLFGRADGAPTAPQLSLSANYPNPFNPSTTIAYSLHRAGTVRLDVFNVAGRRVARLVDGPQSAGLHEVRWNGMDDAGGRVASGTYFYRLETASGTQTRKMVMLK